MLGIIFENTNKLAQEVYIYRGVITGYSSIFIKYYYNFLMIFKYVMVWNEGSL